MGPLRPWAHFGHFCRRPHGPIWAMGPMGPWAQWTGPCAHDPVGPWACEPTHISPQGDVRIYCRTMTMYKHSNKIYKPLDTMQTQIAYNAHTEKNEHNLQIAYIIHVNTTRETQHNCRHTHVAAFMCLQWVLPFLIVFQLIWDLCPSSKSTILWKTAIYEMRLGGHHEGWYAECRKLAHKRPTMSIQVKKNMF